MVRLQSRPPDCSIVDKTPSRRIAGLRRFPYASAYGTIEEALDAEGLDFVDICTPPASHSDILAACLERDLFVICEKPLVCSGEEAMRLMEQMAPAPERSTRPTITHLHQVYADLTKFALQQSARYRAPPLRSVVSVTLVEYPNGAQLAARVGSFWWGHSPRSRSSQHLPRESAPR